MKHEHDEEIQLIEEINKKDQKKNHHIQILKFLILTVYQVAQKKIYALKVMKVAGKSYEEYQKFFNEYEIINILNHLNISKTYGIFLSNENTPPSFLLELCPINLDKAIKTKMFTNCQIVFTIFYFLKVNV